MKYKKNKQKNIKTNDPQTNDKCKIRQVEIKQGNIHRHTHKQNQNQNNPKKTRYKGVTLQVQETKNNINQLKKKKNTKRENKTKTESQLRNKAKKTKETNNSCEKMKGKVRKAKLKRSI